MERVQFTGNTSGPDAPSAPVVNKDGITEAVKPNAAEPVAKPVVPDYIPEKFKSAEDPSKAMAEAYAALEAKLGGKPPEEKAETKEGDEKPVEKAEGDEPAEGLIPGVDIATLPPSLQEFNTEFAKEGKLSDKSYERLAKEHNLPKAVVDQFIALQQANVANQASKAEASVQQIITEVGGKDEFANMSKWAATTLSKDDLAAYNLQVDSGNPAIQRAAVKALAAQYALAHGTPPKGRVEGTKAITSGDSFASTPEMVAAMKDPRYKKDAAYRKEVEDKLSRSNI